MFALYDGPYFIDKVLPNGVYQVKTMNGKMLKQKTEWLQSQEIS